MDVQVEEISALTKKVTVTLPADTIKPKLDAEYDKLKKEVKMKGFRRGKVPRNVIVKFYKGQVESELAEKLVQENYFEALEEQEIEPITHPDIKDAKYNDDGSFTFIAEVDIRPEFELGEYKGVEVEKEEILVTDEEVQLELDSMRKSMAALTTADRPVTAEDVVVVDFQGYHKGNPMPQVKQDDYSVDVGSGNMGAEFEEKLIGMSKGEEKAHTIDFPENHPNPMLKGKEVEFKVKVKDIKERILAELDDDFAQDAGEEYNTLDELKAGIRERIGKQREERAEGALADKMMEKLLEAHDFEVPNRLVAYEIEQMIKQTEQQLEQGGMSLEAAGLSRETLAQQNEAVAAKRVKGDFILKKIAEVEDIKVQDEDLERGFKRIGDMYNMPVAQVKEFFKSREDMLPFMNELLNEKILAFLKENAVFVAPADKAEEKEAKSETEAPAAGESVAEEGEDTAKS